MAVGHCTAIPALFGDGINGSIAFNAPALAGGPCGLYQDDNCTMQYIVMPEEMGAMDLTMEGKSKQKARSLLCGERTGGDVMQLGWGGDGTRIDAGGNNISSRKPGTTTMTITTNMPHPTTPASDISLTDLSYLSKSPGNPELLACTYSTPPPHTTAPDWCFNGLLPLDICVAIPSSFPADLNGDIAFTAPALSQGPCTLFDSRNCTKPFLLVGEEGVSDITLGGKRKERVGSIVCGKVPLPGGQAPEFAADWRSGSPPKERVGNADAKAKAVHVPLFIPAAAMNGAIRGASAARAATQA